MSLSQAQVIVDRLERCVESGKNRWIACCPAHNDRSPSLSITEAHDGRVLLHCFAGCAALDIVESIGLTLSDLFPPDSVDLRSVHSTKPLIRNKATRQTVDQWVLEIAANDRQQGKKLSPADLKREREAFFRVHGGNQA